MITIVGATGVVGREMLAILAQRRHPAERLKLLASARSRGSKLAYQGNSLLVEELIESSFEGIDIALFAAGSEVSRTFVPAPDTLFTGLKQTNISLAAVPGSLRLSHCGKTAVAP